MSMWKIITKTPEQTESIGISIGSKLAGGEIIMLVSDLGGGKTTITRGIAEGLGVAENVSSPTFTISKIYAGKNFELHHYDFYRLPELGIMSEELQEVIENNQNIVVVEWPTSAESLFPHEKTIKIELNAQKIENKREIFINLPNSMDRLVQSTGAQRC